MKKYIMLGVNKETGRCCILKSIIPFSYLVSDEIEESDFTYSATDWGGCDEVSRTLRIMHLTRTRNIIKLNKPIHVYGVDRDMGREYGWAFEFTEIHEVKELDS